MSQFAWLQNACVEGLCALSVAVEAGAFEHCPTAIGKRHDGSTRLPHDVRHGANKTEFPQPDELAVSLSLPLRIAVAQVGFRHSAEGADCCQSPDL
jgi:hypothetical protein